MQQRGDEPAAVGCYLRIAFNGRHQFALSNSAATQLARGAVPNRSAISSR
jgi:hypothetical protein